MQIDSRLLTTLVIEWKAKYGTKTRLSFQPQNVLAFRKCEKYGCSITNIEIHRHHTGYESLFARIHPDHYAPIYLQFNKNDIALVCAKHHQYIHEKVYVVHVERFMKRFIYSQPSIEDCEELRNKLKALCINYLNKGRNVNIVTKRKKKRSKKRKKVR